MFACLCAYTWGCVAEPVSAPPRAESEPVGGYVAPLAQVAAGAEMRDAGAGWKAAACATADAMEIATFGGGTGAANSTADPFASGAHSLPDGGLAPPAQMPAQMPAGGDRIDRGADKETDKGPQDGVAGELVAAVPQGVVGSPREPADGMAPLPLAGEIRINEIMVDPVALSDAAGEWVELFNPTDHAVNLVDCALTRGDGGSTALAARTLEAKAYLTVARGENPGFEADEQAAIALRNAGDVLRLRCRSTEVDALAYGEDAAGAVMPGVALGREPLSEAGIGEAAGGGGAMGEVERGAAQERVDPPATPAVARCLALSAYGTGELGTPGRLNDPCGSPLARSHDPNPPTGGHAL